MSHIEERKREIEWRIDKILSSRGYELWDISITGILSTNPQVRVFIEREGKTGIEDCVKVNNLIRNEPIIEELLGGDYHLEVSSPGVDRALKKKEHFIRYQGYKVRVILKNEKVYKGELREYQEGVLLLFSEGEKRFIPEEVIQSVRIEPTIEF